MKREHNNLAEFGDDGQVLEGNLHGVASHAGEIESLGDTGPSLALG